MKQPILIVLLLLTLSVAGQNYQTVLSNRIALFETNGQVKSLKVDTIKTTSDSVFVFSSNITDKGDWCFTPYGNSWLGKSVTIKANGLNIFLNRDRDSIKIKTLAEVGESWLTYELQDSLKIMATYTDHDTMTFMGVLDSVKTIEFSVYDKNMTELDYPLNDMTLILSKNYGIVKTFNFYQFPNYRSDYPPEEFCEFNLIGINNSKIGVQNLTWFDVFDFEPGDELHIHSVDWAYDDRTEIKTIKKYIKRTDFVDSIRYVYKRIISYHHTNPPENIDDFEIYNDTLKETIYSFPIFDVLPGEICISQDEYDVSQSNMYLGQTTSKNFPNDLMIIFNGNDCWEPLHWDGCPMGGYYTKGLGGPYYYCGIDDLFYPGISYSELEYYKKGDTTWGTPLIITSIPQKSVDNSIMVFSNAEDDFISVKINELKSPLMFELMNMQGQSVIHKTINTNQAKIDICTVKSGVYLYRISNNRQVVKTDKIIID